MPSVLTVKRRSRLARVAAGHEAGFSMLEMVVVLAIVSIAMAVTIPALGKRNDFTILRAEAAGLAAKLRLLRSKAMQTNQMASMIFQPKTSSYMATGARAETALHPDIAMQVTAQPLDGRTGQVLFYPDGSSTGGQVKLSSGTRSCTIEIVVLTGTVAFDDCRQ